MRSRDRFRKLLNKNEEERLEPTSDDGNIEIHNERLELLKPTRKMAGDYICRALKEDKSVDDKEFAIIKLRVPPYINDFGVSTSHTGKSTIVAEGERLELNCQVNEPDSPINITWFKSSTPEDDKTMIPIIELEPKAPLSNPKSSLAPSSQPPIPSHAVNSGLINQPQINPTYNVPAEPSIVIEKGSNSKKLIIESVKQSDRSYYVCMADNGVTERSRKIILVRVKDSLVAIWPLFGIIAELSILFAIIYIWETKRSHKEAAEIGGHKVIGGSQAKRHTAGSSSAAESVPLTSD